MPLPCFGVAGWKNSGKTTLVCKLITEFTSRGFKVAAVKHAHHAFDIDTPGRDSYRFRDAGAREVAVASGKRFAFMTELRHEAEPPMDDLLARLAGSDLILVEGYKASGHPKIETRRRDAADGEPLFGTFPGVIAIAADYPVADGLPYFDLNDIQGMADFIAIHINLWPKPAASKRADGDETR